MIVDAERSLSIRIACAEFVFWISFGLILFAFAGSIEEYCFFSSVKSKAMIEAAIVLGVAYLHFSLKLEFRNLVIGVVYFCFGGYHVFNMGQPCGCLSPGQVSSVFMIVGNFAVAGGVLLTSFVGKSNRNISSVLLLASVGAVMIGAILEVVDATKSEGEDQVSAYIIDHLSSFSVRSTGAQSLPEGEWEMWFMNVKCTQCHEKAIQLVGKERAASIFAQFEPSKRMVLWRKTNSQKVEAAHIDIVFDGASYSGDVAPFWILANDNSVTYGSLIGKIWQPKHVDEN